jgi:formate dehydrogenase subunit gamma
MVAALLTQVVTGLGTLHGPGDWPWYPVHRWSAFLLTPVLLGHIVVASGVLPGYRGVWRSMHLGGRLPAEVARRLWPWSTPVEPQRVVDQ